MRTAPRNTKREATKRFEIIIIIIRLEHNGSLKKMSVLTAYFLKCFALVVQGCDCYTEPNIVLLTNYFGLFEGGTRRAMPKTTLRAGYLFIEAWFRGY